MPLSPTLSRPGSRPRRLAAAVAGLSAAALLGACGEQPQHQTQNEPTRTVTRPPPETTTVPAPSPPHSATSPAPTRPAPAGPGLDPRFRTCKEANAHGYYDYVRGVDPEYYWYIDRDHDGIDCEPGEAETSPPSSPTEQPSPPTKPPSSPTEPPSSPTEPPSPPTEEPTSPTEPPPPPTEEPSPHEPSEPPTTAEPSAPSSGDEHSSDQAPGGEPFATPLRLHLTAETT